MKKLALMTYLWAGETHYLIGLLRLDAVATNRPCVGIGLNPNGVEAL